jgi:hypothetical protein
MDPTIPPGVHRDINDVNDLGALDLFGYNSNLPGPPANDNFANAQTISGCSGGINGTNVAASKKAANQTMRPIITEEPIQFGISGRRWPAATSPSTPPPADLTPCSPFTRAMQ